MFPWVGQASIFGRRSSLNSPPMNAATIGHEGVLARPLPDVHRLPPPMLSSTNITSSTFQLHSKVLCVRKFALPVSSHPRSLILCSLVHCRSHRDDLQLACLTLLLPVSPLPLTCSFQKSRDYLSAFRDFKNICTFPCHQERPGDFV